MLPESVANQSDAVFRRALGEPQRGAALAGLKAWAGGLVDA